MLIELGLLYRNIRVRVRVTKKKLNHLLFGVKVLQNMHILFQTKPNPCNDVYSHLKAAMHKDILISATESFHLST